MPILLIVTLRMMDREYAEFYRREIFDAGAVGGFSKEQVTNMDSDSLQGFNVEQVRNLEKNSKNGLGDKVKTFAQFDIDVRRELVDVPKRRLGGVGAFSDLVKSVKEEDKNNGSPKAEGWDGPSTDKVKFGTQSTESGVELKTSVKDSAKSAFTKLKLFGRK